MQIKNVKIKNLSAELEPHGLAEAGIELADSDGDSLSISDIRYIQGKLRRIQNLVLEFCELVKENGGVL